MWVLLAFDYALTYRRHAAQAIDRRDEFGAGAA